MSALVSLLCCCPLCVFLSLPSRFRRPQAPACLPACALLPQVGRGRAAGVPAPCHAGVPAPCLRVVALASSLALATPLGGMGANASQVSSPVRALRRLAFGRRSCGRQGARSGAACGAWRPPRRRRRGRPGGSLEGVSAFATFCQRMDLRQSEKTRGKYLSHTASQNKSNTYYCRQCEFSRLKLCT